MVRNKRSQRIFLLLTHRGFANAMISACTEFLGGQQMDTPDDELDTAARSHSGANRLSMGSDRGLSPLRPLMLSHPGASCSSNRRINWCATHESHTDAWWQPQSHVDLHALEGEVADLLSDVKG